MSPYKPKSRPLRLADLPVEYLSIDPGTVHCGVARWHVDHDGERFIITLVEAYERSPEALYIELREAKADGIGLVLIEDFQLQKGRNQAGSRVETVKTIGVIEYLCRMDGLPWRLQSPGIKAYVDPWLRSISQYRGGGWRIDGDPGAGVKPIASNSHKRDAVRHGLYPALRDARDRESVHLVLTDHARRAG